MKHDSADFVEVSSGILQNVAIILTFF